MADVKMTNREFYTKVIEAGISEELTAFATDAIAKLDKTNEARKVKTAEKAAAKELEKAPIRQAILDVITAEPKTASTLLKPLIEDGVVLKADIKVKGKGTQRGYALTENAIG